MNILNKPWGSEHWLEENDAYCYKKICINAGHRTSYQYHKQKLETNFLVSGKAEIWLEDDSGMVNKTVETDGFFFTVKPGKKHRIVAITDVIFLECSTPHLTDVIRIEDDTGRPDGRIDTEFVK